jgi:hypothetical protein
MQIIYTGLSAIVLLTAAFGEASAKCAPGVPSKIATGPTGITLEVCLDGKYDTCVRDSRRLGWHEQRLLADCGRKRDEGKVK